MGPKRKQLLLSALAELYPDPHSELNFKNEYQLLIAVLLSAQCTDKKVNQIIPELFTRYPTFEALSKAALTDVERIIRQINYFKTKSKHLIETGRQMVERFDSIVPKLQEELVSLPGVGRKTANVIWLTDLASRRVKPQMPSKRISERPFHRQSGETCTTDLSFTVAGSVKLGPQIAPGAY